MLDEIDSVNFVLDEISLDSVDVERMLVGTKCVVGCLVVNVIMELVYVILGVWLDKDDGWWEGIACIILAGSPEHFEMFSFTLKSDKISFRYMLPYEKKF